MSASTLATVAKALKLYYLEGLRYQLNDKSSVLLAQLERNSEAVVGEKIVMALRHGRVGGIGNRADNETLPTPNSRKTEQAIWETKNVFTRFQMTDKVIEASKSNVGAFANLLEQEIMDCETDMKQDISRQVMGSTTGALTTITGANTTTSVPVADTTFLHEGMRIDIWDVSAGGGTGAYLTTSQNLIIESVTETAGSEPAGTIVLSAAPGAATANGDILYVNGNKGLEMTGVQAVFEDTTLYGIARATNAWLNAQRVNVNGALAEVTIQKAIDDSERKAGGNINMLLSSFGVRRGYQALLTAQKQHVNTLDLKGGWKALSYNGIPFAAEKYIRPQKLYCMDLEDWALYHMGDFDWMDMDGSMFVRVADKPVYEATLRRYMDIGCQKPRGQVELYGITES